MTEVLPYIRLITKKVLPNDQVIEEKQLEVQGITLDEVKKIFDELWEKNERTQNTRFRDK